MLQNISFAEKVFRQLGRSVVVNVLRTLFVDHNQVDDDRADICGNESVSGALCDDGDVFMYYTGASLVGDEQRGLVKFV